MNELYKKAKEIIITEQKAQVSLLQRKLKIGYAQAAYLMDILEEEGIVSPLEDWRPRKVLVLKSGDD